MTQRIVTYQGQGQPACSLRPWAKKFAETATKNVNMQKLLSNIISDDYNTFQELMEPRAGCLSQSFVLNVFIEDSSSSNDIFWNRFRQIEPLVSVQVSIFEETRFFHVKNFILWGTPRIFCRKLVKYVQHFNNNNKKEGERARPWIFCRKLVRLTTLSPATPTPVDLFKNQTKNYFVLEICFHFEQNNEYLWIFIHFRIFQWILISIF